MLDPNSMKTTMSAFALSFMFSCFAQAVCPKLTGSYDCVGGAGKGIHVELKNLDGSTYVLEDQIVIRASTSGVETVTKGDGFKMTLTATCRDQALDVETEFSNPANGEFFSFVQRSYLPKPSGDLDVLVTWNDADNLESSLIRCQKKSADVTPVKPKNHHSFVDKEFGR